MFDSSKRARLYRQGEQIRQLREAASIGVRSVESEIALREQIIDAAIRAALALERAAEGPMIGRHTRAGVVVGDWRAEMRASAADESRRVAEMFKELRPLVGLSGEAWIQYMQAVVTKAVERHPSQSQFSGSPGS